MWQQFAMSPTRHACKYLKALIAVTRFPCVIVTYQIGVHKCIHDK